jgi:xanthine dehydrogenase YagR molybdenum-binding subunit
VRIVITRPQMFTSNGHREEQEQRIEIGARRDGTLTAIRHVKLSMTSPFDDWAEPATGVSSQMYACESFLGVHRLIHGNTMTPTFTRGPASRQPRSCSRARWTSWRTSWASTRSSCASEPTRPATRKATRGPATGLEECLHRGAERFGWQDREPAPRSTREGDWLIGQGMAVAGYPVALFMPIQRARARVYADGSAVVEAGTQDFGTGVATLMTQVGADALGVALEAVTAKLGDTDLPNISSAVGSAGATMVGAAIHAAGTALHDQLVALAVDDAGSPLHRADPHAVEVADGRMRLRDDPAVGETYGELLARNRMSYAEQAGSWRPPPLDAPLGLLTFGAQFAGWISS